LFRSKKENDNLGLKGIMRCPEHAFVYLVARELSNKCQSIDCEWEYSDKDKKSFRRLDLYIKYMFQSSPEINIAIEFKMGYSPNDWKKDVEKLKEIKDDKLCRMFCLLKTYEQKENANKILSKFSNDNKLDEKMRCNFPTKCENKNTQCFIVIWKV
jgi:hypothetical protein